MLARMPFLKGEIMSTDKKTYGLMIRIDDEYDKMLKFIAGYERKSNAEIAKVILQPGLKKLYESCLKEFKKTI